MSATPELPGWRIVLIRSERLCALGKGDVVVLWVAGDLRADPPRQCGAGNLRGVFVFELDEHEWSVSANELVDMEHQSPVSDVVTKLLNHATGRETQAMLGCLFVKHSWWQLGSAECGRMEFHFQSTIDEVACHVAIDAHTAYAALVIDEQVALRDIDSMLCSMRCRAPGEIVRRQELSFDFEHYLVYLCIHHVSSRTVCR